MKETTKSSTTSMMVGNGNSMDGGFDEQLQSGQHIQIHHHYNIQHHHHHHHYHNQNEANVDEKTEPKEQNSLKESLPINTAPSNGEEEQKSSEKTPPTEALPMNSEKPYVMIQSAADHACFLSVGNGKVVTASFDPYDKSQVELITYNPEEIQVPLMWTLSFGHDYNRTKLVVDHGDYMRLTTFGELRYNLVKGRYNGDPVNMDCYDPDAMLPHMWRVIHYCESVQLP